MAKLRHLTDFAMLILIKRILPSLLLFYLSFVILQRPVLIFTLPANDEHLACVYDRTVANMNNRVQ